MAAARLDHPVLVSAEQIRRREFVTTRRGYDPDQVRLYLVELADQIDVMASMIREARMEAETAVRPIAQPQVDPYEQLAARVGSVIREADETAERLRVEGRREAEHMLGEARDDAYRIRTDAQAKAEQSRAEAQRAVDEARQHADRTVSGLAIRRQAVVDQLAQMQERLLGVARDLEAAIDLPLEMDDPVDVPETAAPSGAPSETSRAEERIVDVRDGVIPPAPPSGPFDTEDVPTDPSYEDLWEGTEAIQLEVPDIPPLDLSWGMEDDEGRNGST